MAPICMRRWWEIFDQKSFLQGSSESKLIGINYFRTIRSSHSRRTFQCVWNPNFGCWDVYETQWDALGYSVKIRCISAYSPSALLERFAHIESQKWLRVRGTNWSVWPVASSACPRSVPTIKMYYLLLKIIFRKSKRNLGFNTSKSVDLYQRTVRWAEVPNLRRVLLGYYLRRTIHLRITPDALSPGLTHPTHHSRRTTPGQLAGSQLGLQFRASFIFIVSILISEFRHLSEKFFDSQFVRRC